MKTVVDVYLDFIYFAIYAVDYIYYNTQKSMSIPKLRKLRNKLNY